MSWIVRGPDRWEYTGDDERHLLLHAGTRYIELHGHAVHVYAGPAEVPDPESPLAFTGEQENTWVLTDTVNVATEAEAWAAMADPRFTEAT